MQVTPADAYAEACRALGEAAVMQTFLAREIARLAEENDALRAAPPDEAASP